MLAQVANIVLLPVALVLLLAAAAADLRERILPNRLVALIASSGLLIALALRPEQAWINVLAAAIVYTVLAAFAHLRLIGGGDVKLIAASTLFVPVQRMGALLLAIVIGGGMLSFIYLAIYSVLRLVPAPAVSVAARSRGSFVRWLDHERRRILAAQAVPYGVAVAAAVAFVMTRGGTCFFATSCSP